MNYNKQNKNIYNYLMMNKIKECELKKILKIFKKHMKLLFNKYNLKLLKKLKIFKKKIKAMKWN